MKLHWFNIIVGLYLIVMYEYAYTIGVVTYYDKIGIAIGLVNFIWGILGVSKSR